MNSYVLEKAVWEDADFPVMGWHDATIWSMVADPSAFEFMLDLDYIFKWVPPGPNETYFKFWVAPVTMVFENAAAVKIDIESGQGSIEVADLHRETLGPSPNARFIQISYRFECQEGVIQLQATSYKLFVRRTPRLLTSQAYELRERDGVDFGRELTQR